MSRLFPDNGFGTKVIFSHLDIGDPIRQFVHGVLLWATKGCSEQVVSKVPIFVIVSSESRLHVYVRRALSKF